ncbi:hypothetical protein [Pontibacter fetidus]|uniref:Uncharacterized protein n=1 Tax=Pontibacter fetidus TaxID=2700082 RepID=A0A6B2H688_9BACT|nr:hypothetical protein [Pontibacter fetidus]NDK56296.1 hypothetical protein [Pontibacter fetidus]
MKTILPLIITILTAAALGSCNQDNVSPIRNVRFDPKLLNPMKIAGGCPSYSYFSGSKLTDLGTIHTNQLVVAFDKNLTPTERENVLKKYGFLTGILSQRASQSGLIFTLGLANGLNCAQTQQAIAELNKDKAITYAGPSFKMADNQAVGLSNEVVVKTEAGGEAVLRDLAARYNTKLVGPLGEGTYLLQLDKNSEGNALDISNALKGQKGIAYATPDFILAQ